MKSLRFFIFLEFPKIYFFDFFPRNRVGTGQVRGIWPIFWKKWAKFSDFWFFEISKGKISIFFLSIFLVLGSLFLLWSQLKRFKRQFTPQIEFSKNLIEFYAGIKNLEKNFLLGHEKNQKYSGDSKNFSSNFDIYQNRQTLAKNIFSKFLDDQKISKKFEKNSLEI